MSSDALVGENIFEHIRHLYDLERRARHHFEKGSLWKAIVDHISHDKYVTLVSKPSSDASVQIDRGTGRAIHLKDIGVYAQDIREVAFWIKFQVEWTSEDGNTIEGEPP